MVERGSMVKQKGLNGFYRKKTKSILISPCLYQEFSSEGNQKFTTFLKREKLKWT